MELNSGNKPAWGADDVCPLPQKGLVYCCRDRRRVLKYHHHHDEVANDEGDEKQADYYMEEDTEITYLREAGSLKVKTASDIAKRLKRMGRSVDQTVWTPYRKFGSAAR